MCTFSRLAIALLLCGLCTCSAGGGPESDLSEQSASDFASSQPRTPPTPLEFRVLRPTPILEAVALLPALAEGDSALSERAHLAEVYRKEGFIVASRFFDNTLRMARSETLDISPVVSSIAWSGNADYASERPLEVATEVVHLTQAGRYREAVAVAKRELEEEGLSLQVVVQWADAVLWQARLDRESVGLEALEAALRIEMTSVEVGVPRPLGLVSRSGVYARLSDVFLALDDRLSSLTAGVISLALLEESSESQLDDPGPFARRQLCDRIRTLLDGLDLPANAWPEDTSYDSVCSRR